MSIQEIQNLRPGPYILYFHPDKDNGYGVYRENRSGCRMEEQELDPLKKVIVGKYIDLEEVSERERDLQRRNGYRVDRVPYYSTLKRQIYATMPKALKKRSATNSKRMKGNQPEYLMTPEARAKAGKKASERQKGKPVKQFTTPESREKVRLANTGKKRSEEFKKRLSKIRTGMKIGHVPSKFEPVIVIHPDGRREYFEGQVIACETLNLKPCGISACLNPDNRQNTHKGYRFERPEK